MRDEQCDCGGFKMWDGKKQQQLNELRRLELEGTLTPEEREALDNLLHELEQEEWQRLRPTLQRLHAEQGQLREACARLRSHNVFLAVLLERQEELLTRARAYLAELLSEHELLKAEYERITGEPLKSAFP
jgi:chromosome segregation ATPase